MYILHISNAYNTPAHEEAHVHISMKNIYSKLNIFYN